MSQTSEKSISHEQLLVVSSLLAGFSFTGLMMMLQSSGSFRAQIWPPYSDAYFTLLVSILTFVSADLIQCSMGMAVAAAGRDPEGRLWSFNLLTFIIGLLGLMLFLPLLILPIFIASSLIVIVFEVSAIIWYFRRAPRVPLKSPYRAPSS